MGSLETQYLARKLIFFAENLLRLLDQSSYWAVKRIELRLEGKYEEAGRVERTYLEPLDRKINALIERGLLEL